MLLFILSGQFPRRPEPFPFTSMMFIRFGAFLLVFDLSSVLPQCASTLRLSPPPPPPQPPNLLCFSVRLPPPFAPKCALWVLRCPLSVRLWSSLQPPESLSVSLSCRISSHHRPLHHGFLYRSSHVRFIVAAFYLFCLSDC